MSFSMDLDEHRARFPELEGDLEGLEAGRTLFLHGYSLHLEAEDRDWLAAPPEAEESKDRVVLREALSEALAVGVLWLEMKVAAHRPELGVPDDAATQVMEQVERVMGQLDANRGLLEAHPDLEGAFSRADERLSEVLEQAVIGLDRTPIEQSAPALPPFTLTSFVSDARTELVGILDGAGGDLLIGLPNGEIHELQPGERRALRANIEREGVARRAAQHHLLVISSALSLKIAKDAGLVRAPAGVAEGDPAELERDRIALGELLDFLTDLLGWAADVPSETDLVDTLEPVLARMEVLRDHLDTLEIPSSSPAPRAIFALQITDFQASTPSGVFTLPEGGLGGPGEGASGAAGGTASGGSTPRGWKSDKVEGQRSGRKSSGRKSKAQASKSGPLPPSASGSKPVARRREPDYGPVGSDAKGRKKPGLLRQSIPRWALFYAGVGLASLALVAGLVMGVRWFQSPRGPLYSEEERRAIFRSDVSYFLPGSKWVTGTRFGSYLDVGPIWDELSQEDREKKLKMMCLFPNEFSQTGSFRRWTGEDIARCVDGRPEFR